MQSMYCFGFLYSSQCEHGAYLGSINTASLRKCFYENKYLYQALGAENIGADGIAHGWRRQNSNSLLS